MRTLWILGSGKMALDVGSFFLSREFAVVWLSASATRLDAASRLVAKSIRRLARCQERAPESYLASFVSYAQSTSLPAPDVLLECTREDLEAKRNAVESVSAALTADTLRLSNSSSILPSLIHTRCVGMHFFYPTELTRIVEIIATAETPPGAVATAVALAESLELAACVQDEGNAFAANRLLLPVQAACLTALAEGFAPAVVDDCSAGPILPMGQLGLMDSIGLDVVHAAVGRYAGMEADPSALAPLLGGLGALLGMGTLGKKNQDGFLAGRPLPWPVRSASPAEVEGLRRHLHLAMMRSCESFAPRLEDLDLLLARALQSERSWRDGRG
jgi:3-hydroxyacyl-CoA dehydrogenase